MTPIPRTSRQYSYPQRGSYNNLTLKEVPLALPKSNEVLVKTHAVSLQYRDLMIASATYPTSNFPQNLIPCSDMAGEVVAVGADVKQWRVGDRVSPNFMLDKLHDEQNAEIAATALGGVVHGVLTEYRTFPAHSLVEIPAHLSYEEAATLPATENIVPKCAAVTAYNALTAGYVPVKAGDTVLVLGTGGVSTFALQFAIASGARVISLSSSDEKLKAAAKLGATHVINYRTTPKWDEEVKKLTNGLGVDRVIEVVGNATLQRSINAVRINGSIDIIGLLGGTADVPPVDIIVSSLQKGLKTRGIYVGSVKQFRDMIKLIQANVDATRPMVDKVFGFEEAKDAFAYLASQAHVGKVVITV